MKQSSLLKSPKKEETQLVPENYYQNIESLEDIKGFLGLSSNYDAQFDEEDANFYKLEDHSLVNNDNNINTNNCVEHEFFGWDFMNSSSWETYDVLPHHQQQMKDDDESFNTSTGNNHININISNNNVVKNEELFGSPNGYWDENVMDETKASLNLNLNYEEVLEAWSNRGSLWAHNHHPSFSVSNNHPYMGEVPNLEDERTRRETSVLRYKEKRQSRLFSKKIRYEVRKLNADKRPRLKGRFVKRCCDDNSKV